MAGATLNAGGADRLGNAIRDAAIAAILAGVLGVFFLGLRTSWLSREILAEHGNMSSPTVFFVLKRVLEDGHHGRLMLAALGPGFTASCEVIGV